MDGFRDFDSASQTVKENYRLARQNQTYEFVQDRHQEFIMRPKLKIGIWEAMVKLNEFTDLSDPDVNLPNFDHLIQTVKKMEEDGCPEWMLVVGLIHDLGKIMYTFGSDKSGTSIKNQWAIVGDTFLVGCPIPETIVYPEFNILNPDTKNPKYNNGTGIYEQGCGLDQCYCSWGHDEYLYQILKCNLRDGRNVANEPIVNLPPQALSIIRYHSLYVWHQQNEYSELMTNDDMELKKLVQEFNKYDLYTKSDVKFDQDECRTQYEPLLRKYLGDYLYF